MVDISREMYERNSVEKIVDNDGIFWLNEKDIEKILDHKLFSDCGKDRYQLTDEPKKQSNKIFIGKN